MLPLLSTRAGGRFTLANVWASEGPRPLRFFFLESISMDGENIRVVALVRLRDDPRAPAV